MQSRTHSVYNAISPETALFFELQDPVNLFEKIASAQYQAELHRAAFVGQLATQIAWLDSAFTIFNPDGGLFSEHRMLVSMNPVQAGEIDFLYVIDLAVDRRFSIDEFSLSMKAAFESGPNRSFRDRLLYETRMGPDKLTLTYTFTEGLLLVSFTSFMVEDAIVQLADRPSILESKTFSKINSAAGKNFDLTAFVNLDYADLFAPGLLNSSSQHLLSAVGNLADWAELEISFRPDDILLYGYLLAQDSTEKALSWLSQKPTGNMEILEHVPDNTGVLFYHSISDFDELTEQDYRTASVDPVFENYFKDWVGNEWAFFVTQTLDANIAENTCLVVKLNDEKLAIENMNELAGLFESNPETFEHWGITISRLTSPDLVNQVFGNYFVDISQPYFFDRNGHLFFTQSRTSAKLLIEKLTAGSVLNRDFDYLAFKEKLSSHANLYIYFNPAMMTAFTEEIVSTDLKQAIVKFLSSLRH